MGAESVWDTIKSLDVERIGHGINSIQDQDLIKYLNSHNIGLDISITSNYLTDALKKTDTHPVVDLYNSNCSISLNTDDPGFFHTNLNKEYQKFIDLGYTIDDLRHIVNQSIDQTFLIDDERETIRKYLK